MTPLDARVRSSGGWLLAIALCGVPGCGPDGTQSDGIEPIGGQKHAVAGGILDVDTPVANAVVRIRSAMGWLVPTCTGVLVTPDVVLTNARCVFLTPADGVGTWQDLPGRVTVFFGRDADDDSVSRAAVAVNQPPAQIPALVGFERHYLAALRLATPVPATVAVPRSVYTETPIFPPGDDTVHLAGFGGGVDRSIIAGRFGSDPPVVDDNGSYVTLRGDDRVAVGDLGAPVLKGDRNGPVMGILNSDDDDFGHIFVITYGEGRPSLWPPDFDRDSWITQRDWLRTVVPTKPDFRFRSTRIACIGREQRVVATVENRGMLGAATDVSITPAGSTKLVVTLRTPLIRAQSSVQVSWPVTTYFPIPGEPVPSIVLRADPANMIDEHDEGNNLGSVRAAAIPCF